MRVRSHWFAGAAEKSAADVASAAGFIAFRVARNGLANMRKAGYELPADASYFAFLAEFCAFLVHATDRIAHRRGDEAWRLEFTTAMANKVGEFLAGNEADLLGADSAEGYKRRFVELVNARAADYATCGWDGAGPDYGFVRCFGHCAAATMTERDRSWAVSQLIECEAPEAVETLQRAMAGLLDTSPRRARGEGSTRGE